ncbi:MAG: hypothetical protein KA004_17925 [Verrucomicrobiales bacterium]|nr:hypothetical protein [Verrucomicrobiales bacterium]
MPNLPATAPGSRQPMTRRLLLLLLAFIPAILLGMLVKENAVDIACWDMWENGALLKKYAEGSLGLSDLYAAQIQHRIVIPRLLIIAMAKLSGGDFRVETWASFSMFVLSGLLVYRLLRRTLGPTSWVPGIALVVNLLLFTPMLYQNLLWGSSLWMSIPMPCLLGAILLLSRENADWKELAGAVVLMEIATHSFSHGLAMWPLLFTYILLQPGIGGMKKRAIHAGIWAAIAAVTIGLYMTNFYNQAFHAYDLKIGDHSLSGGVSKSLSESLQTAAGRERAIQCFFGYLGSLFSRDPFEPQHPLNRAAFIGKILLAVYLAMVVLLLGTKRGRSLWRPALPWLALASYAIGVGLLVGFGRTATVPGRALTARYISVAVFLPVSTLALGFLVIRGFAASACCPWLSRESLRRAGIAGLAAFAALQLPAWSYGSHLMRVWKQGRLQGKALAMFVNAIDLENAKDVWEPLDKFDKNGHQLDAKAHINTLKSLGLFKTPVLETAELRHFKQDSKTMSPEQAGLVKAEFKPQQNEKGEDYSHLAISGYARFSMERPADLVLFADKDGKILLLGQPETRQLLNLYSLDYEFTRHPETLPPETFYPFTARLFPKQVPEGRTLLQVWALDVQAMRIRRLATALEVSRTPEGVLSATIVAAPK